MTEYTNDIKENKRKRGVSICAHVLFMLILFILPELVLTIAFPHRRGFIFYPGFYIKTLIYISAFYVNYFIIIDRTLAKPGRVLRISRFLLYNLIVLVIGLTLGHLSTTLFSRPFRHTIEMSIWQQVFRSASFVLRDAVMIILTIGLSVALRLPTIWANIDNQQQKMLAEQRSSELAHLKSQLNPHFLFNTLNTIYALVDIGPDEAKKALHRLSALLRYMLYEDVNSVRLSQEAQFIEDYVSLMRLRICHREVKVNIDITHYESINIPPLLFVALVENAFKFGITGNDTEPIEISMCVKDAQIAFATKNSYSLTDDEKAAKDSGIGLVNLRRRLQLLYGNKAVLNISKRNNIYEAQLSIPLNIPQA
ncbi:MAG: histidine kinase [Muribaculaceae bacterium]|nr:histidine kinase [Muribaculaceae bacterium]